MKETEENEVKKDVKKESKSNKDMKIYMISLVIFLIIVILSVGIALIINKIDSEEDFEFLSYDIEQFNIIFSVYEGEQRASGIKALMTAVVTSNNTNEKKMQVEVYLNGELTTAGNVQSSAVSTKTYNVEFEYNEDLFINKIMITENEE